VRGGKGNRTKEERIQPVPHQVEAANRKKQKGMGEKKARDE